jgi:ABC-2 type transport system permease protein
MSSIIQKGWCECYKARICLDDSRRTYLMVTLILPVICLSCQTLVFIKGVPRDLPVGLVDLNRSATSRKLARMVDAVPSAKIVSTYR